MNPDGSPNRYRHFPDEAPDLQIQKEPDGEWVTFADYADLRAKLVEGEGERDAFRAITFQVVPGEHGQGIEIPCSPESLKAGLDELQDEWDGAEKRLAAALARAEAAEKDRDQWKANHDNQVEFRRILMDRPDLQERSKSMQTLIAERDDLRRRIAELEALQK